MRLLLALLIALFAVSSAQAAEPRVGHQWDAYFVRGAIANQQQLAEMLGRNDRSVLKVSAEHLVRILGNEGVPQTINVATFVQFLRSAQVFEVRCQDYNKPGKRMYRVSTDHLQTDGTWSRPCYADEMWLAYKDGQGNVVPFLSKECGNPLRVSPPPANVVSECMALVVRVDDTAVTTVATVRLWGGNTNAGCGLRKVQTICCKNSRFGRQPDATYQATIQDGVMWIPRSMVMSWTENVVFCLSINGYVSNDRGLSANIFQPAQILRAQAHAEAGEITVLIPTGWISFNR